MNYNTLRTFYAWAVKGLIFVIPFLSLWISRSMFFPYITGRNFAFRILIEIALALWLGLMLLDKSYRPKSSWILWAVIIFTFVIGITNSLGVDPFHSFWSRLERMEGYLMILHLAAYFLILTSVFRTKKDWFTFFNLFVIVGVLVGGYGILQVLGLKEAIQGGGVRIDGTIGNPTYLAAYLTLVSALALILLFNAKRHWLKYIYGAAIVFSLFVMFFTASRGAALAWLISVPLFLLLYLIFFKGENSKEKIFKRIVAVLLALIIITPISLWLLRGTTFVQNSNVLSRLTSVSLQEKTIRARFMIWNMSWQAFKERPLTGWGQGNFIQAFSKYFDPRLFDQEPWFDRPHNIVFEWLINGGIFGLLSYAALFGTLYLGIGRLLRQKIINKKEGLVLIVVPIAYFVQNFFVFDNFNTYVLFFGLLAYVDSLRNIPILSRTHDKVGANQYESTNKNTSLSLMVLTGALIVMLPIIYFINIKPAQQARGIIRSLIATSDQTNVVERTLDEFKKTLAYNTFANGETLEQLARTANLLVGQEHIPNEAKIPFVQFSIEELEKYLERFPKAIRIHLMLGSLYQNAAGFNQEFIFKSREHIQAALALSPTKQQIIFLLANNYLFTGEIDKALELLQRAVELEPSYEDAQTNLATVQAFVDNLSN